MPIVPTTRSAYLFDGLSDSPLEVAASIIRDLPSARLEEIERLWKPAREQFSRVLALSGDTSEHGHWDWRNKVWSIESGRHRIVAVECRGEIQGLMAVATQPRPAAIGANAEPVLYVDYLETAPWNLRGPATRVGTVLIEEAFRISRDTGWGGRVGLHSLSQAERFYLASGMTRMGPDPDYYDLVYFEYNED